MIFPAWRGLLPVALFVAASAAQSQSSAPAPRPDPLDPAAEVPSRVHGSAFAGYRGFGDDKPMPWTQANQNVGRIGGWRAYAREASQPDAPVPPPGAAAPASGPAPAPSGALPTASPPSMPGRHHGHPAD